MPSGVVSESDRVLDKDLLVTLAEAEEGGVFQSLLPEKGDFSRALYTFDIGQNDLTDGYKLNMSTEVVKAYVPDVLAQFTNVIKYIYAQGGVFQSLLPEKGDFSRALYTFDIGQNDLTAGYKLNMSTEVVKAYVPDVLAQFTNVIKYIYAQGFKNPFLACCGHGGKYNYNMFIKCGSKQIVNGKETVLAKSCKDPYHQISWDGTHFTEEQEEHLVKALPPTSGKGTVDDPLMMSQVLPLTDLLLSTSLTNLSCKWWIVMLILLVHIQISLTLHRSKSTCYMLVMMSVLGDVYGSTRPPSNCKKDEFRRDWGIFRTESIASLGIFRTDGVAILGSIGQIPL
ncbi:hypothetical protein POM88_043921 [Heracleum sosnowskyi]|uniref:GDSL esterase/lipase n=1 Tax=Heracleum sosnowskyi TaxID=360622 RepID=A0AAD8M4R2_9APIA|nr:hypothetical protein POM88_043921 [Heracleum sosnowskyi]